MLDRPDAATAAALARLTTSTSRTTRATSTSTWRWPTAPTARSWSWRPAVVALPSRWPRPATRSRRWTSIPRCSIEAAPGRRRPACRPDGLEFVEADLLELHLPDAGRYALRLHRAQLDHVARQPRGPAGARSGRSPTHLAPGRPRRRRRWLPDAEDLARFDGRVMLEWPRTRPRERRGRDEGRLRPARRRDEHGRR